MPCCSGSGQVLKYNCELRFRPLPDREYVLPIILNVLSGSSGAWQGLASADFDFGDLSQRGCGATGAIGIQNLTVVMELICAEGIDQTSLNGHLLIFVAKVSHRFKLPNVFIDETCEAVWDQLFLQFLGAASISLTVRKRQ